MLSSVQNASKIPTCVVSIQDNFGSLHVVFSIRHHQLSPAIWSFCLRVPNRVLCLLSFSRLTLLEHRPKGAPDMICPPMSKVWALGAMWFRPNFEMKNACFLLSRTSRYTDSKSWWTYGCCLCSKSICATSCIAFISRYQACLLSASEHMHLDSKKKNSIFGRLTHVVSFKISFTMSSCVAALFKKTSQPQHVLSVLESNL